MEDVERKPINLNIDPWPGDYTKDWMSAHTVYVPSDPITNPDAGHVYHLSGLEREWQMHTERNQQTIAKCALAGVRFEHRVLSAGCHRWQARMPDGTLCCETNNINSAARHALAILESATSADEKEGD